MLLTLTSPGAAAGPHPILLSVALDYLKVEDSTDEDLVRMMLDAVLLAGEGYTGRDFRANTWHLFLDEFADPIWLEKSEVASVSSVSHWTSAAFAAVTSSVYQTTELELNSRIDLAEDQVWPDRSTTATDVIKHGVRVAFVTRETQYIDRAKIAMLHHLSHLYANRGDCADQVTANGVVIANDSLRSSGAASLYDGWRIPRV